MQDKKRIMVVDDDELMCRSIVRHLKKKPYEVNYETSAIEAGKKIGEKDFDILISDYRMPGVDGIELIRKFKHFHPEGEALLVTGVMDFNLAVSAVNEGIVYKFVTKPFEVNLLLEFVNDALTKVNHNLMREKLKNWSFSRLGNEEDDIVNVLQKNTIEGLMQLMKAKDLELYEHSTRIGILTKAFAKYIFYEEEDLDNLYHAALLHDIGKIAIKDQILDKRGSLDPKELQEIRKHPVIGADLLKRLGVNESVQLYVLQHHEWVNGQGYPRGLKKNEIEKGARIIAIIDAYDALRTKRAYKNAYEYNEVKRILENMAGQTFDSHLVEMFIDMLDKSIL